MFPCIQCLWQALQRAVALFPPPNLHRTSRTDRGLAELAPRCGSFLAIGRCKHSKQFVHYPRAAVIVPFRRLPTHSTVSVIFSTLRVGRPYRDLRSRYGVPPPNPHSRCRALSLAKPSTFHWPRQPLPAHNSVQVSCRTALTALARCPQTSRYHTFSPCQVSFLAHPAAAHTIGRLALLLTPLATRRNAVSGFCRAQITLRLVPRCRVVSHRKELVYLFSQAQRVRFIPKASNTCAASDFPHRTTLPTISNRTARRNMVSNVRRPQSDTVPQRQAFFFPLPRSPCRRSDVPQASTHKHFAALAPSRTIQPSRRAPRRLPLCPRQPPTTHP